MNDTRGSGNLGGSAGSGVSGSSAGSAGSGAPWWTEEREDHTPPPVRGKGARRPFGQTWWGRAWIGALEERVGLDQNRLPRGRSYARRGTVHALQLSPGLVLAQVQGSRVTPYTVTVQVTTFTPAEWERLLDVIAGSIGHVAALLDGELPPEVAADAGEAGLDLLPGAGDVRPRCSCPDWADPCKHAAAVCFVIADRIDADPFALFQLRGRAREDVLAGLRFRRTTGGTGVARSRTIGRAELDSRAGARLDSGTGADLGVDPREAFARTVVRGVPAAPMPPERPGTAAASGLAPPPDSGLDPADLEALANDAAHRAWELATGSGDGALDVTYAEDLARWAARMLGTPGFARLRERAGVERRELTGPALAWQHGGAGGVRAATRTWEPADPDELEALEVARRALNQPGGPTAPARIEGNQVTRARAQLRLGRDRLWYPFVRQFGAWDPAGPALPDPQLAAALPAVRSACRGTEPPDGTPPGPARPDPARPDPAHPDPAAEETRWPHP